jgi:mRNA-degrading endonuclease RelE of RelBE toxin-antitoxin system
MRYEVAFTQAALAQVRALPKLVRAQIGRRITQLQDDLQGDVRKLSARENAYRLRVGSHRILFRLDRNVIQVYAVKDRKNAYE